MGIYLLDLKLKKEERDFWAAQRLGNKVVSALEKYRSAEEKYPITLDELVPKYLGKIIPPPWGEGYWIYRSYENNKDKFSLAIRPDKKNRPPMYYTGKHPDGSSGGWYYDTDGNPDSWTYEKN